jgi:hypothetical protein
MSSLVEPLPRRLFPLPPGLVASPLALVCVALLANAVCQPYLGLFHDARLYAFYLESRLEPAQGFDQDLYLAYGSQDRYSLFAFLLFPLVKIVGLTAGMFTGYLLSKALLFWGFQRLVRVLVRDDSLTAVIVLFLAVVPIPFGGNEVFHVNEPFLTPRLLASACVLLALERMLAGKLVLPLVLLLSSLAMHPLMGVGGVLTFVLWWSFGHLSRRQLVALGCLAVAGAGAVLAYEPLGTRVFGHMDDTWRATNLQICFFIRPSEWAPEDWARLAWDVLIVVVGGFTFARHVSRFLWAVLGAGLIGLVGSLVGVESHYLLLIQTSPYRTLWLLEFLAVPLGFLAVAALWRRGTPLARCGSLGLLLYVSDERVFSAQTTLFILLVGGAAVLFLLWHRGLNRTPADPDWLWKCGRNTFLCACGLLVTFAALVVANGLFGGASSGLPMHPTGVLRMLGLINSRLVCLLAACQLAGLLAGALGVGRRLQVATLGVAVAYLGILTYLDGSSWYLTRYQEEERHTEFVADFLRGRRDAAGHAPCVYWNTDIDRIWFRLRATSYVTIYQMAGCAFQAETASEGKRREHLVARFEADADRKSPRPLPPRWQQFFDDFRDCPRDAPPPTRADLLRLAQEEKLDYAVLQIDIDHLYAATDGRYFIYDCKRLRALGDKSSPSTSLAATGR